MKFVFRPFGVGFEDIDSKELHDKGKVLVDKVVEQAMWSSLVAIGLSLIAAAVITRKVADGLSDAARVVADYHDRVITPAQRQNAEDKINHAWSLTQENSLTRIDSLIADVKARNETL